MKFLKLTFCSLLLIIIAACQLNPFGSKKNKQDESAEAASAAPISIEADATARNAQPAQQTNWRNAASYRQWKNAKEGIVEPNPSYNSYEEYQEYLQWLEFQKLKNKSK